MMCLPQTAYSAVNASHILYHVLESESAPLKYIFAKHLPSSAIAKSENKKAFGGGRGIGQALLAYWMESWPGLRFECRDFLRNRILCLVMRSSCGS